MKLCAPPENTNILILPVIQRFRLSVRVLKQLLSEITGLLVNCVCGFGFKSLSLGMEMKE